MAYSNSLSRCRSASLALRLNLVRRYSGPVSAQESVQTISILVCRRTIDQGNEVYGFQNRFGESIVGSINHFQQ